MADYRKVAPEEHQRIADQYNDANMGMALSFGSESPMVKDVKKLQNRYWRMIGTGDTRDFERAVTLRNKLRQMADAIDHDLKQMA